MGLDGIDTNKVFQHILKSYEKMILEASKSIVYYTIDIVIMNANGLKNLGEVNRIYEVWGDNYFVDFETSTFIPWEVNDKGSMEISDPINFQSILGLEAVEKTPISIKELIDLCKENNFKIKMFSEKQADDVFTIEVDIFKQFAEIDVMDYLCSLNRGNSD